MPARIVVGLKPESAGSLPPPQTGPAVSAAVLASLRDGGYTELATAMHDAHPPKAYAVTPLLDEAHRAPGRTSEQVRFEVGVLRDELMAPVLAALTARSRWEFGRTGYVTDTVFMGAAEPYPELLAAARPATTWAFHLLTPVTFITGGLQGARRQQPLPDPERLFGALLSRWRAHTGDLSPLPDGTPEAIEGHLEITDFELRATEHLIKAGVGPLRGAVGTVRYTLVQASAVPAPARCGLDALARFALYAGVGNRTNVGMGYVLPDLSRVRPGTSGRPGAQPPTQRRERQER